MQNGHPQPIVTVDVVLLTLKDGALQVALSQREHPPHPGEWTLPGGWVHVDEDEDALAAAVRILKSKTGLQSPYLEQLQTFANRHRDSRGWSVSIAYYALVPYEQVHERLSVPTRSKPGKNDATHPRIQWRGVDSIRSLPFDHQKILETAVSRVRSKTLYSSLPIHLMPKIFTLSQLQNVYEQVLGSSLDKRTFRRRIEELDLVEPIPGALEQGGAHRPAQCYRVKRRHGRELALAEKNLR
jgi:8-oxo-dGTP diphosphatase